MPIGGWRCARSRARTRCVFTRSKCLPHPTRPGVHGTTSRASHPLLSPACFIRVRHATNQPARAPRKISLRMAARVAGDTHALFQGRYEIDRPSTGALALQAVIEMDYVDDPAAPLPRVPAGELARVLALAREAGPATVTPPTGLIYGRSSDSLRTLRVDEFAATELELKSKAVSAFGRSRGTGVVHAPTRRHAARRVYYRVLAVSRWEALFSRDFREPRNGASGGGESPPVTYTNRTARTVHRQEAV